MIKKHLFKVYEYLMPIRDKLVRSRFLIKLFFNVNIPRKCNVDFDMTTVVLKYAINQVVKSPSKVFEMGVGTGSLLSIMISKKHNIKAYGADISARRVEQSKKISYLNNVENNYVVSNLFEKVKGKFEFIIFNPPYVPSGIGNELNLGNSFEKSEEKLAWDGGEDGTAIIKRFFNEVKEYMKKSTLILVGVQGIYISKQTMKEIISINNLSLVKIFKLPLLTSVVYFVKI